MSNDLPSLTVYKARVLDPSREWHALGPIIADTDEDALAEVKRQKRFMAFGDDSHVAITRPDGTLLLPQASR